MNIFKPQYSDLYTTFGYSINTIGHIIQSIGYNLKNYNKEGVKEEVLGVTKELLNLDLIYVSHWGKHHNIFKKLELNIEQTIKYIDIIWNDDVDYIDFEGMVTFKYKDWYLEKMKENRINIDTDWNWFSTIFVPNMNKWIKK